ncbi:type VII secretion protein EsaA [Halobacillus shinanisalinarum]|uniref:Type VII secretion protein EsaA n=1 Tax=Halobacillus shinanisalinarum TaxID=2932258 RepID=A0ABY4H363_9BACI|nr:type VII secretion protein EsaA [Halobacillus shinanisalinarum]UOQ94560.1 type VII secretion protein EsaA [Halobacillus shinanisalinarum]
MKNKGSTIKLIIVMLAILILPTLYFTYIGENPLQESEKATGKIAVVNEDNGTKIAGESVTFGQDLTALVSNQSDYEWETVSRATAQGGLSDGEYDAIFHVKSNFSEHVMSFEEQQPTRASIDYQIQPNLEVNNQEEVKSALESAGKIINGEISSLYWSNVSQEIEDLRNKFDNIVEREIEFQQTMYAFYSPNSQDIAQEIDKQRSMLKDLFSTVEDAENTSSSSKESLQAAEDQVASFLNNVERYQEYQKQQQQLFLETNNENVQLIENRGSNLNSNLQEGIQSIGQDILNKRMTMQEMGLRDNVSSVSSNLNGLLQQNQSLQNRFGTVKNNVSQLQTSIKEQGLLLKEKEAMITKQREILEKVSGVVSDISGKKADLRDDVTNNYQAVISESGPDPQPEVPDDFVPTPPGEIVSGEEGSQELEQMKKSNLSGGLATLEKNLEPLIQGIDKPQEQKPQEDKNAAWNTIQKNIDTIRVQIGKLGKSSENTGDKGIIEEYRVLYNQYQDLIKQLGKLPDDKANLAKVKEMIKGKESEVLSKDPYLQNKIGGEISSNNIASLAAYYGSLTTYAEHLEYASSLEGVNGQIQSLLADESMGENPSVEKPHKSTVNKNLSNVEQGLTTVEDGLSSSEKNADLILSQMKEYDASIKEQQEQMRSALANIQESGQQITASIQEDIVQLEQEPPPVEQLNGEIVLETRQSTVGSVDQIADLVNSLSERQSNVIEYTGDLQAQISSVQGRADSLNNKWASNVNATEKVQGDVNDILDNTVVDGQVNNYVYDYLSTPVNVVGSATDDTEETPISPVVMLIIILISGLIIGFFVNYYSNVPALVNLSLFLLLTISVGLIISIYGLNIYSLEETESIKWTAFTVLVLFMCSSLVRLAFSVGPFLGWFTGLLLVVFFVTPLLNVILPNFSINHPIAEVYMSIQYGDQSSFYPAVIILAVITVVAGSIPYIVKYFQREKEESDDIQEA